METVNKYLLGKIYKIICDIENSLIYIGSTTQKYLSARLGGHKSRYRKWKLGGSYKITSFDLFEKYGIDNCKIILIESFPCQNKDELRQREQYYIETMDCVNKAQAFGLNKERVKENGNKASLKYRQTEKFRATRKAYETINKEKISERNKKWYETNKECIREKRKNCPPEKKEIIKAQNRRSYEKSKSKILADKATRIHCNECDCDLRKSQLLVHSRSQKHINNLNKEINIVSE